MTIEQSLRALRPNKAQQEALQILQKTRGKKTSLVALATGVGKTFLAAWDIIQTDAKTVLYIVHQRDIAYQNAKEIAFVLRSEGIDISNKIGFLDSEHKEFSKPILFATKQTVIRNLKWLKSKHWDYVISDEAHHDGAKSYKKIIKSLKTQYLLGLTATPFRNDMSQQELLTLFGNNLIKHLNVNDAIKEGFLVPYEYHAMWDNINYSKIPLIRGKCSVKYLEKSIIIDTRNQQIAREYLERMRDRQAIGFCVSVKHANKMARVFKEHGINAIALTYQNSKNDRKNILQAFRNNKYQVLFTRDLFMEGMDYPNVSAILLLRPTDSDIVFAQQIGRGLRKAEGKFNVIIHDYVGNERAGGIQIRERFFGIKIKDLEKGVKHIRPVVTHHIPQVYFDDEVIEYCRRLDNQIVTKQKLIENLWNVYKMIGHVPKSYELALPLSRYTIKQYIMQFGLYRLALREAGFLQMMPSLASNEEMLQELRDIYNKHSRINTTLLKCESKYSIAQWQNRFRTIRNAAKQAGTQFVSALASETNDEILNLMYELWKENGYISMKMMSELGYSESIFQKRWGSFRRAQELSETTISNLTCICCNQTFMIDTPYQIRSLYCKACNKILHAEREQRRRNKSLRHWCASCKQLRVQSNDGLCYVCRKQVTQPKGKEARHV